MDSGWSAWPNRREGALIAAFWALLTLILLSGHVVGLPADEDIEWFAVGRFVSAHTIWALLTPCIFWLAARQMVGRNTPRLRIPLHIAVALAVSIAVHLGVRLICMHVLSLENPCPFEPWAAIINFAFINELMIYGAVLATGFARAYYHRQRAGEEKAQALEMQKSRLEAQLSKARLDTLRMQLNPHFLFNTLNSISSMVETDPKGARAMVARLSDLLRSVLDEGSRQEIPLDKEMQLLEDYLEIQQIRFGDRLTITTSIAPETNHAMVPAFLLQPLVENTVKHGVQPHADTTCIRIEAEKVEDMLQLTVSDNGPGPEGGIENLAFGTGLSNIRERLEGLYGNSYELNFTVTDESGLSVAIRLPYYLKNEMYAGIDNGTHSINGAQAQSEARQ